MSHLFPAAILTPVHIHGARDAGEYRELQRTFIQQGRRLRPALNWQDPWLAETGRPAFVTGGKWVVSCRCGNAPSADPEWRIACCFECGARYERVEFPADADAIVLLLLVREPRYRGWQPHETLVDLLHENAALEQRARQVRP